MATHGLYSATKFAVRGLTQAAGMLIHRFSPERGINGGQRWNLELTASP